MASGVVVRKVEIKKVDFSSLWIGEQRTTSLSLWIHAYFFLISATEQKGKTKQLNSNVNVDIEQFSP